MTKQDTVYVKTSGNYVPTSYKDLEIHDALPVTNYIVVADKRTGELQLHPTDAFNHPKKVYGDFGSRVDRIMTAFNQLPNGCGVLMTGEKGSGKSQLARLIALRGYEAGMPCILINQPHVGEEFFALIQKIEHPCVVVFDEFEKVYDAKQQQQVLTLLDGVYQSKKLFVITANDAQRLDGHLHNRPGRVRYVFKFEGIDPSVVHDLCNDALMDKANIETVSSDLVKLASRFGAFNFDMAKAVIDEINLIGGSVDEVIKWLNVQPHQDGSVSYTVTASGTFNSGKDVKVSYPTTVSGHPVFAGERIRLESPDDDFEWLQPVHENIISESDSTVTFGVPGQPNAQVIFTRVAPVRSKWK